MSIRIYINDEEVDFDLKYQMPTLQHERGQDPTFTFAVYADLGPWPHERGQSVLCTLSGSDFFRGEIDGLTVQPVPVTDEAFNLLTMTCTGPIAKIRRARVQERYTDTRAGDILKSLNTRYAWGLDVANVVDGPEIPDVNLPNVPGDRAIETIAELSGGYAWRLTPAGDLYFQHPSNATRAPFDVVDGMGGTPGTEGEELTTEGGIFLMTEGGVLLETESEPGTPSSGENKPYFNLTIHRARTLYYNRVKCFGGMTVGAEQGQSITQDGTARWWGLYHAIHEIVSLFLTSTGTQTFGRAGEDDDSTVEWVYHAGTTRIERIVSLGAGNETLAVRYKALHQLIYAFEDENEIQARGIYEAPPIEDESITTIDQAYIRCREFLAQHNAFRATRLEVATDEDGLEVDMLIGFTLANFDLSGDFQIRSIKATALNHLAFTYRATIEQNVPRETNTQRSTRLTSRTGAASVDALTDAIASRVLDGEVDSAEVTIENTLAEA